MAEQSGQDTEVERAGEAEGEQESVQPAKRVIWTPERLAKAAATRAETKRKKEEKEARKAAKRAPQADTDSQPTPDTPEEVLQPSRPPAVAKASAGNNGFDWDKAPLAEAINHLADMKREYDRVAQIVMRRQSTNKPSWVCWSQLHKDIVPVSVQKLCRKTGEDGKWAFRDDGVFKTENGIRMPDPVFCCNTFCFECYQKSKPLVALSRPKQALEKAISMNLERARLLFSKLFIKDREKNISVPFVLNPNQMKAHRAVMKHYEDHGNVRVICDKARRVGMSSYFDALAFAHCLARPQAHAMIVAHLKDVADKGLFRVPRDLASALNDKFPNSSDVRTKSIIFHHSLGESNLDIATAGSVGAGRGMTLTFLHLSECAQYPGQESFLSILPAVAKADDTFIILESTAQGRTGIGETFYEYWNSANKTGRAWNGFTPIFLSWLDDPACTRPEVEAEDAPASDFEKDLMKKPFCATKGQIAWMRMVLEGECRGSEMFFSQEYPWTPEVSFIATGDPAFTTAEINYALSTKRPPLMRGSFLRDGGTVKFVKNPKGKTYIWEYPQARCHYYVGVDCARGIEAETGRASGDFAAYVVLNGTTGDIAARFCDWVNPIEMADDVDKAGRYYNKAMMNIELTGNLGLWCQQVLRDQYMYPNWYIWKGKDDKMPGKSKSHAMGFETQGRSRDLLLATFRGKLHDGMKNMPGGLALRDEELIRQMDLMTMATGMRWEIEHGHDDVFMACCFAVIACSQYPPPNIANWKANYLDKDKSGHPKLVALNAQDDLRNALKRDIAFIMKPEAKRCRSVLGEGF